MSGTSVDSSDVNDVVLRFLNESTVEQEDAINELWRNQRATFAPRRWILIGNRDFCAVPPLLPANWVTPGTYVRVHYVKKATQVATVSDPIDASIPDYYQEFLRYAATAYLMEKDTDLKSAQFKIEMMASFNSHMAGGIIPLAQAETDS